MDSIQQHRRSVFILEMTSIQKSRKIRREDT